MDLNQETALRPSNGANSFLESPRIDRVPAELKAQVIEIYGKTGNFTSACRMVGIDPRNMRLHLNADPEFRRAVDEAREGICDKAEGHIVEHMSRPSNVVDRLAWLRAWRPAIWNPKPELAGPASIEVTVKLAAESRQFIDTTATPTDKPTT